MIERYHFPKCHLNIGQHKTIDASLHLEVKTKVEDEYAEPDPTDKSEDYTDGVRVTGELAFDSWPVDMKHPIRKNAIGQITINDAGDSTRFNVLFVEKNGENTLLKDHNVIKLKRYFWLVFAIGRPVCDGLEIFPDWYRGKLVNKVFTCTDFRGIWPIGVSSVVVAKDKIQGKHMLIDALKAAGVDQPEINDLTLQELDLSRPGAVVLNSGTY
jgi:hypothetical protein